MKGRSVSALSAIVLLLLSMVLNTSAYGRVGSNWRSTLPKVGSFVSTLKQNLTHKFVTGLAAATIVCSASSCSVENGQNDAQISADEIVVLTGHRSTSIDEIIAAIEQVNTSDTQLGIIRIKNEDRSENGLLEELSLNALYEATDNNTVLLKLSSGDVLINKGTQPLEIGFTEDEGWIAEGSPIARNIAWGTAIVLAGLFGSVIILATAIDFYDESSMREKLRDAGIAIGVGAVVATTAGAGVYQILVWL